MSEQPEQQQQQPPVSEDVAMNDEQQKALDESMALAQQLQDEEMKGEGEQKQEEEGESISGYVNQEYAKQLIEMGFPKAVAEKALFFTLANGGTTEKALEWIDQHSEDADFNEELKIVGKQDGERKATSNLTKEEKIAKAKELQEQIRKKRVEEEKKMAEEQERNRIASTKAMSEVKRKLDEQQQKLALEQQRREKQEFLNAKQQMLDQLRRDKEERFGKKMESAGGAVAQVEAPKTSGPQGIDLVKHGLKTVKTLYTEDRQPGVAKTCFKTCQVYLTNVLKDKMEEKFQRINLGNDAFQKRVGKITGGMNILKGAGFVEQPDNTFYMEQINEEIIKEAIRLLENSA